VSERTILNNACQPLVTLYIAREYGDRCIFHCFISCFVEVRRAHL